MKCSIEKHGPSTVAEFLLDTSRRTWNYENHNGYQRIAKHVSFVTKRISSSFRFPSKAFGKVSFPVPVKLVRAISCLIFVVGNFVQCSEVFDGAVDAASGHYVFEIVAWLSAPVAYFILGVPPTFENVSRRYFSGSQLIEKAPVCPRKLTADGDF